MKIFWKIIAGIIVLFSILGILVSLAGVVGAWWINTPVTQALTEAVTVVRDLSGQSLDIMDEVEQATDFALGALEQVQEILVQVESSIDESQPLVNLISLLVGKDISPRLDDAWKALETLEQRAAGLNAMVQSLNALPFIDFPKLAEGTQAIQTLLSDVINGLQTFQTEIAAMKEGVSTLLLQPLNNTTSRLITGLTNLGSRLGELRMKLQLVNKASTALLVKIPGAIDIISIGLTVLFLWLALAQVALTYLGIGYMRNGSLALRPRAAELLAQPRSEELLAVKDEGEIVAMEQVEAVQVDSHQVEGGVVAAHGEDAVDVGEVGPSENPERENPANSSTS